MTALAVYDDVDVGRLKYLVIYTAVMFVLYGGYCDPSTPAI